MTSSSRPQGIELIVPSLGKGSLRQMFGGKPFIHCLIEMVKNSRDYGATQIAVSFIDRDRFIVTDDGVGMGVKNRSAFASVNTSTATSPQQAGRFGSGTKHTLYSHALEVVVITACKEDPQWVYRFSFTTESYEDMVLSKRSFLPERMPKSKESWPFQHPFGTQIEYRLADPTSRGIMRGEKLASELAARLPLKFRDILTIDGSPLPEKKIVGRQFTQTVTLPKLGSVSVELYRPERRRSNEDLLLAGVEVGEIPIRNVFRVLGDFSELIPTVFRMDAVCGTIAVPAFRDYANEDRQTVKSQIADDPNVMAFIRYLQRISPQVQQALELKVDAQSDDEADRAAMDELRSWLTSAYGAERGPEGEGPVVPPPDDEGGKEPPREADPIRLVVRRHEYEPGERIEITARLRADIAEQHSVNDLKWQTKRSHARDITKTDTGIELHAHELGTGVVTVDLPGTPHGAVVDYQVVARRVFRLSASHAEVDVGTRFPIMGINTDRLTGTLVWGHTGAGRFEPDGARGTFTATKSGEATVTARGSQDPSSEAACLIRVRSDEDQVIRIRNERFQPKWLRGNDRMRPVNMSRGTRVHDMIVCEQAKGFKEARERGALPIYLAMATAQEYARFDRLVLHPEEGMDHRDISVLQEEILSESYAVFEEILRGSKK